MTMIVLYIWRNLRRAVYEIFSVRERICGPMINAERADLGRGYINIAISDVMSETVEAAELEELILRLVAL